MTSWKAAEQCASEKLSEIERNGVEPLLLGGSSAGEDAVAAE